MPSAQLFARGVIQWLAADPGGTIYTFPIGFEGQAFRFWWMGLGSATDTTSTTTDARRGMGLATSPSARRCVATYNQDSVATSVCASGQFTDCIAATLDGSPARTGALDLHAVTVDSFSVISDDPPPVDLTLAYEVWGGLAAATVGDIAEPAAIGDQDYSAPDFDALNLGDQVVFLAGVEQTAVDTVSRTNSGLSVGVATSGDPAQNIVISNTAFDASATSLVAQYAQTDSCLVHLAPAGGPSVGTIDANAALTAFLTNQFRLNWRVRAVTNRRSIYLAIKGGTWQVGTLTVRANVVGNTATYAGLPFTPGGVHLFGPAGGVQPLDTPTAINAWTMGTARSPTARVGMGSLEFDDVSTPSITLTLQYDQIAPMLVSGSTFDADLTAITRDGFTLTWNGTTTESTSRWHGFVAFQGARKFLLV